VSLLLATLLSTGFAAEKANLKVTPIGDLWFAHDQTTVFPVDTEGTMGGQGGHIDLRHRFGLELSSGEVRIGIVGGGPSDQIWGDTWTIPGSIDERARHQKKLRLPSIRKLALTADLEYFQIETGLTTSHWGLGMLANNGENEPFFGQPEFGDRVVRARVTTKPSPESPWHFTAAWDRVLSDELTIDVGSQWTNQALFSVLWHEDDDSFGLYGGVRRQDELLYARTTRVTVLDGFTKLNLPLNDSMNLHLGFEAAGITGKTNRATTYNSHSRVHILSAGAVTEAMIGMLDERLQVGFGAGFASGDGDPNDDTLHDFSFDRNFGVGMVLFDEVMGSIEAAQYNLLTDPDHMGQPPDGVEASVYEGAFRRASYIQPRFQYDPTSWAKLRMGMVFAWSTAPVSHGFYTHRNGGVPVNHLGQPTEGYALGTEFDWSVQLGPFVDETHPLHKTRVSVQGGHAFLDSNLGGDEMGRIDRYLMMLHVL
jgi:hypothetical protein